MGTLVNDFSPLPVLPPPSLTALPGIISQMNNLWAALVSGSVLGGTQTQKITEKCVERAAGGRGEGILSTPRTEHESQREETLEALGH